ncbi:NAD(P)-dependent oxidoreductase [Oceanicoccus sp. KOV_DT_Chl]|uniref:NAD(P)-dependent oxidoreductase n=1 Tax=Oceanicoccus sp. KOV_DT_Chl TaxID=1904639 RepID=UPI000C7DE805|nr:NAD(P)-dependent oxidoreductase [Oceanicoccus sp. KOV_DT_Chl]
MNTKQKVGYIGLGNIGKPSAERLINRFQAHVYDVYQPAVQELIDKGAIGCTTTAELAKLCSHIGICVRDDQQVEDLLYGDGGLFKNVTADTIIAIHSTVTQANLLKWASDASALNIHLIDAPITGGAHRAVEGTLCYMVGGDAAIVARAQPVFETSAEKVVHAGDLGTGIALKLCNNFIQYGEFVLLAEATKLADRCGLSVDVLREVGRSNGVINEQMHMFVSGRNSMAPSYSNEQMIEYFGTMGKLARKDLECALNTAKDHNVVLPTAEYLCDRIEDVFVGKDESRLD